MLIKISHHFCWVDSIIISNWCLLSRREGVECVLPPPPLQYHPQNPPYTQGLLQSIKPSKLLNLIGPYWWLVIWSITHMLAQYFITLIKPIHQTRNSKWVSYYLQLFLVPRAKFMSLICAALAFIGGWHKHVGRPTRGEIELKYAIPPPTLRLCWRFILHKAQLKIMFTQYLSSVLNLMLYLGSSVHKLIY